MCHRVVLVSLLVPGPLHAALLLRAAALRYIAGGCWRLLAVGPHIGMAAAGRAAAAGA
eukprot:COSAG01_NODE_3289_length_6308_cov_4.032533_1_plen_57_part_10